VHWRPGLETGRTIPGPAILEALDSTTIIPPDWIAAIDALGFIRLTRS
jgi:N-methylhydantoinase A/oxoprolinase/acetone carboxylase beta subunit